MIATLTPLCTRLTCVEIPVKILYLFLWLSQILVKYFPNNSIYLIICHHDKLSYCHNRKNKKHPRYTGLGPVLDSHNLDIFFGFLNHVILEWVIFWYIGPVSIIVFFKDVSHIYVSWAIPFPWLFPTFYVQTCETSLLISTLTHLSMGLIRWWSFLRIESSISCPLAQQALINQFLFSVIQFKWLYVMIIRILINNAPCSNSSSTFHSTIVIVVRILVYQDRL